MRRLPGEITVFLSLILVCVLSLLMGLLESARTTGARWYLQMASNSAITSVMSQYNRNLWDMYRLLFLEYESEQAITDSFQEYLNFYLEQENYYNARMESVQLSRIVKAGDNQGSALEQEILDYVKYRLPDIAGNLAGIAAEAAEARKAGDFRTLLDACKRTGERTKALERARADLEKSLEQMREEKSAVLRAADAQDSGRFQRYAKQLLKEVENYPRLVANYEQEIAKFSENSRKDEETKKPEDEQAYALYQQEQSASREVLASAEENQKYYRSLEPDMDANARLLSDALNLAKAAEEAEENEDEGSEGQEADWDEILELAEEIRLPEKEMYQEPDSEKEAALDRLEQFFQKDLLDYLVPADREISNKQMETDGMPSKFLSAQNEDRQSEDIQDNDGGNWNGSGERSGEHGLSVPEQLLVNEYIFLFFDSFLIKANQKNLPDDRELSYEQEYILCGEKTDRENLKGAAEQLLAVRGALNLLHLLGSQEKRAQAEAFAAAVSAGYAPVQLILSFFILTLWALGEAVLDVRELFAGGKVNFCKNAEDWKTSLESLFSLEFLALETGKNQEGSDYTDYLRVLLCLKDTGVRNGRILDVIQCNVRKKQVDFSILSCASEVEVEVELYQKHLFFIKDEYCISMNAFKAY